MQTSRLRRRGEARAGPALGLVMLLALLCVSVGGRAQTTELTEKVERLRRELQRTDEFLRRTGEELREADVPQAHRVLSDAVEMQRRARTRFTRLNVDDAGKSLERELREVLRFTLAARDRGTQAGRMLREELGARELAGRSLAQARQKLAQLREEESDLADSRIADVMQRVREQLDRAERHLLDEDFELSLRQSQTSLRLLESLESDGLAPEGQARLQREFRRTKALLRRTSERIGGEESRRRWERAETLHRDAGHALREGQPSLARARLRECRQLLRDLWSELGDEVDDDALQRAFVRFDEELRRLRDKTPTDAPRPLVELLDRATSERGRAGKAFESGDRDRALQHLRAGTDLLARARRRIEGRPR